MADVVSPAAFAVALVLVAAAVSKSRAPQVFREQLADYRVLPYPVTGAVSALVIALEAAAVPLLVIPRFRQAGALLALALFATFLIAQFSAWRSGRRISCACFGGSALDVVGVHSLLRTVILCGCAAVAALPADGGSGATAVLPAFLLAGLVLLASEVTRLATDLRRKTRDVVESLEARIALNAEQGGT